MSRVRRFPVLISAAAFLCLCASSALARPTKLPDLTVIGGTASTSVDRVLLVDATVLNRGTKEARASRAQIYLSDNPRYLGIRTALLGVPKLKPSRSAEISGEFVIPASVPADSYEVFVCADVDHVVKEKDETNQCKAAVGEIVVSSTSAGATPP